jgi:hypothetical protein
MEKTMTCDKTTGAGCYPKQDWPTAFQQIVDTPPATKLFELSVLPPVSPPGADVATGCKTLKGYQDSRTTAQEDEVTRQANPDRLAAIHPILDAFGIRYTSSEVEARALVETIGQNIDQPVFKAKAEFGRGRPRMMCQDLTPMLEPPDSLHPAHGSYPSAHAATAHCWAMLLGVLSGDAAKAKKAVKAAEQVARNREIAGVHFPSDTVAGRALGEAIAKAILDAKGLTPLDIAILLQR